MVCVCVCMHACVWVCVHFTVSAIYPFFFFNFIIAYYGYYPSFAIYLIVEMVLYIQMLFLIQLCQPMFVEINSISFQLENENKELVKQEIQLGFECTIKSLTILCNYKVNIEGSNIYKLMRRTLDRGKHNKGINQ